MIGQIDWTGGLNKGRKFFWTSWGKCCLQGVSISKGKIRVILFAAKKELNYFKEIHSYYINALNVTWVQK